MALEVSTFLTDCVTRLAADYPDCHWRVATPTSTTAAPQGNLIGTVGVDDTEEMESEAVDRMTGAWYMSLPVVVSLYFNRAIFPDYEIPRDFAFTIGAWFRRRLVGIPSQAVSEMGTIIRQTDITQKIPDGVDASNLANWMLWQVRAMVPQAITPQFPAIATLPGIFDRLSGPPGPETVMFDEAFYSENPDETNPANATQLIPE